MNLEKLLIPIFLASVQEGDAYAYSSGPRRRSHPRMSCESSSSKEKCFESSPGRSYNGYKQRRSRVDEAFRELQKEFEDDADVDFIGATTAMNSDSFFKKRNMADTVSVDKEIMKKWVKRGFDFASDFNKDFSATSRERELNEKILKKSRDWVNRMYKVVEESSKSEKESTTNTENDNGNDKHNNTNSESQSGSSKEGGNANTEETISVSVTPSTENRSTDKSFQVAVDLPGVERSKIEVAFEEDFLTIVAIRESDHGGKPNLIYQKRFALVKDEVDMDKIDATLKNGVLLVTIPKKKIETKPKRQITIN